MSKYRKTLIIDIDGTLIAQPDDLTEIILAIDETQVLPGVREQLNKWHMEGHRIILLSARPESMREHTTRQLTAVGLFFDQLVLGATNGPRYIINNRKRNGLDTAYGITVDHSVGLEGVVLVETNNNYTTDYKARCKQLESVIAELYSPTDEESRLFSEHEQLTWSAGGSPPDLETQKVEWAINKYGN